MLGYLYNHIYCSIIYSRQVWTWLLPRKDLLSNLHTNQYYGNGFWEKKKLCCQVEAQGHRQGSNLSPQFRVQGKILKARGNKLICTNAYGAGFD